MRLLYFMGGVLGAMWWVSRRKADCGCKSKEPETVLGAEFDASLAAEPLDYTKLVGGQGGQVITS